MAARFADDIEPAHVGQEDVDEQRIGLERQQIMEPGGAVERDFDFEARTFELAAVDAAEQFVVLDDENLFCRRRERVFGAGRHGDDPGSRGWLLRGGHFADCRRAAQRGLGLALLAGARLHLVHPGKERGFQRGEDRLRADVAAAEDTIRPGAGGCGLLLGARTPVLHKDRDEKILEGVFAADLLQRLEPVDAGASEVEQQGVIADVEKFIEAGVTRRGGLDRVAPFRDLVLPLAGLRIVRGDEQDAFRLGQAPAAGAGVERHRDLPGARSHGRADDRRRRWLWAGAADFGLVATPPAEFAQQAPLARFAVLAKAGVGWMIGVGFGGAKHNG